MKKILSLALLLTMLTVCFTGCGLFKEKVVTEETLDFGDTIPEERMEELVIANNDVVSTIYGEPKFFTSAELRAHVAEYYTQTIVRQYFTSKVFYDEDGEVKNNILIQNGRKNIANMNYKIDSKNIYIINETQSFTVTFYDDVDEYRIKFNVCKNTETDEWLLTDIFF